MSLSGLEGESVASQQCCNTFIVLLFFAFAGRAVAVFFVIVRLSVSCDYVFIVSENNFIQ
jgi:hypothetical protein